LVLLLCSMIHTNIFNNKTNVCIVSCSRRLSHIDSIAKLIAILEVVSDSAELQFISHSEHIQDGAYLSLRVHSCYDLRISEPLSKSNDCSSFSFGRTYIKFRDKASALPYRLRLGQTKLISRDDVLSVKAVLLVLVLECVIEY